MATQKTLEATVKIKREPGHLYFVDAAGDVCKRKANRGHTPSGPYGENHPTVKVAKTGIKKRKGWMYYLDKAGKVWSQPMHQFRKA